MYILKYYYYTELYGVQKLPKGPLPTFIAYLAAEEWLMRSK